VHVIRSVDSHPTPRPLPLIDAGNDRNEQTIGLQFACEQCVC